MSPAPPASLDAIGWSAFFQEQLDALDAPSAAPARVVVEYQDRYRLLCAAGPAWGQLSGTLRREAKRDRLRRPAVGDWVALQPAAGEGMGTITHCFGRRSRFVRQAAGRRAMAQVVAANIDTLFVVTSFREDLSPRRIERYLSTAGESGARAVLVLNKADLVEDPRPYLEQVIAVAPDTPVVAVSAARRQGLALLRAHVAPGETIALLGSSGVGKSTLVNWLIGHEVQEVGEVRARDGRGQHTTTHRELLPIPGGGVLIDTPGMRELQLWTEGRGLREAFADIESLATRCRFRDCRHGREPGCAVVAAMRAGRLDQARLRSYLELREEQQGQAARRSGHAAAAAPRRRTR